MATLIAHLRVAEEISINVEIEENRDLLFK